MVTTQNNQVRDQWHSVAGDSPVGGFTGNPPSLVKPLAAGMRTTYPLELRS
jgi:hypothetical protein